MKLNKNKAKMRNKINREQIPENQIKLKQKFCKIKMKTLRVIKVEQKPQSYVKVNKSRKIT